MQSFMARSTSTLLSRSLFTSSHLISAVPATAGKKGALAVVKPEDTLAVQERESKAMLEKVKTDISAFSVMVKDKSKLWKEMHEIYYGKERDMKNFPVPKVPEYHPKVRLGFIPDAFFQVFYNKTGVTGPYLFLYGGLAFVLSKEILIVDHEFDEALLFYAFIFATTKLFGPKIAAFFDKSVDKDHEKMFRAPVRQLQKTAEEMIQAVDVATNNEKGQTHLFQAKRENVDLQLELAYRSRLDQLHKAVKARLDYQVEREIARRQFQQQHMVNWIVDSVVKGISPQQEKDILTQCIKDLQSIAKRQTATA